MKTHLNEQDKADYVRGGDNRCPYCGGDEIEGDAPEVDGRHVTQDVRCVGCDGVWRDVYTLSDVAEVYPPEPPEPPPPADPIEAALADLRADTADRAALQQLLNALLDAGEVNAALWVRWALRNGIRPNDKDSFGFANGWFRVCGGGNEWPEYAMLPDALYDCRQMGEVAGRAWDLFLAAAHVVEYFDPEEKK